MKVAFYTLGCKVNLYETEYVMNLFKKNGYEIVDFDSCSDIYLINTCTVTNSSDSKSKKAINKARKNNPNAIVIAMGCFVQTNKSIDADILIGNNEKSKIIEFLNDFLENKNQIKKIIDIRSANFESMELEKFETKTRAFLKIQDGCNNFCSYCIIPYVRGNVRSKAIKDVILEAKKLVKNNYKEIVLTGIHTGFYGKETNEFDFSDLLIELEKIKDLKRIRISSIEVTELNDKFLNVLKNSKKIANHLHIPLQSGNDKILKLMNRKYDKEFYENKIEKIRNIFPDISITTDLIVGFPGESEENFNDTINFLNKMKFSKIHVFPFSKREKTKAAYMENQLDNKTKKNRVAVVNKLSKDLEIKYMNRFINQKLSVIFEFEKNGYIFGHSSNYILVKSKIKNKKINEIKNVKITDFEYPYLLS